MLNFTLFLVDEGGDAKDTAELAICIGDIDDQYTIPKEMAFLVSLKHTTGGQ